MAGKPGERLAAAMRFAIGAQRGELSACLAAFVYIFCLFTGYSVLRPVRDTMGIAGGVENLPWMFLATFLATLVAVPFYGWLCSRYRRGVFLPWVYLFFIINLALFYAAFSADPDNPVVARVFFVWLSVYNLFVVSVFWSFMADIFSGDQAKRLFGFVTAGASSGFIIGPTFTVSFAETLGTGNLVLVAAGLLTVTLFLIRYLLHWSRTSAASSAVQADGSPVRREAAMGGNPFAGFTLLFRSPYLLTLAAFIFLYTAVSTFIYLQQAELVRDAFASSGERTRIFAFIDLAVNVISLGTQVFLTGRIVKRVGMVVTLAAMPVFMIGGFVALAAVPTLTVLIVVQVIRRSGNYAITRPAREMLYTAVDRESRYKVKNVIDTVVYRGGDAANAGLYKLMQALGLGLGGIAAVGVLVAALWTVCAIALGRLYQKVEKVPDRTFRTFET